MTDCQVCCEKVQDFIVCTVCDYISCQECFITFLQDKKCIQCMNCSSFNGIEINGNELKTLEKKMIIQQELDLLPEANLVISEQARLEELNGILSSFLTQKKSLKAECTELKNTSIKLIETYDSKVALVRNDMQPHFEIIKQYDVENNAKVKDSIYENNKNVFLILDDLNTTRQTLDIEINQINTKQVKIKKDLEEMSSTINQIEREINSIKHYLKDPENNKLANQKRFLRKCPQDSCLGLIQGNFTCDVCAIKVCSDCREIKADTVDNHQCDDSILKSIRLCENDSKECPVCATLIYKISGCNQFFCVMCHTAFNWETLEIITGKIDNPHYFEYLASLKKKTKKNGGLHSRTQGLSREFADDFNKKFHKIDPELTEKLRVVLHIKDTYPTQKSTLTDRIDYITKKIDLQQFGEQVYSKRSNNKLSTIIQEYTENMTNVFYTCINTRTRKFYQRQTGTIIELDTKLIKDLSNYNVDDSDVVIKEIIDVTIDTSLEKTF